MIDRSLMTEPAPPKIPIEMIEGTNYNSAALGGGAVRVNRTTQATATSGVVANGTTFNSTVTFTVRPPVITNPQPMYSIYVDNDNDLTWLWPDGSNLSSANRPRVTWGMSEAKSDPANGIYCYDFSIKNESGGNQSYFLKVRMLLPNVIG